MASTESHPSSHSPWEPRRDGSAQPYSGARPGDSAYPWPESGEGYGSAGQSAYGYSTPSPDDYQPNYHQNPYGQHPYGQGPYGQGSYGVPGYAQPPYGDAYGTASGMDSSPYPGGQSPYPRSTAGLDAYHQQAYDTYPYQIPQGLYGTYGSQPPQGSRSALTAGLFGIFLGSLGVHNFYLGRNSLAIAQLLMTLLSFGVLTPVTHLWGLIEGILYLGGKGKPRWDTDGEGYRLQR